MRAPDGLGATINIPVSLVDSFSRKIVAEATPQVYHLIAQEKSLVSEALYKSLPFVGGSVLILLGTIFLIPDQKFYRLAGYLLSSALLGGGILMFVNGAGKASVPSSPPPSLPPSPSAHVEDPKSYQIKFDF
jgi:hypothetical protein